MGNTIRVIRGTLSIVICVLCFMPCYAVPHTTMTGIDSVPAQWFREWYHRSDLIFYLEAQNDHTIVETHTTGQWWTPERLTFAIDGLPYTANRYYINGFRIDDRFQPGSTNYVPNIFNAQPLKVTIAYDNEIRNRVVDWVKAHYDGVKTLLGQPILKMENMTVEFKRVIK